ncbi:Tim44/TimA family putative adaptor protein [Benzoatithermus flavus]|uniref:Tim44/TimA family putative adaptor protein n=1 Tax=Benzoatithermus flavus TaxID=3108223 RepID=A0ABU8XPC9_9PROT
MSDGFAYLDILFFAMIAAFIAFRLRSVLGRKTGHERPRVDPISQRTAARAGEGRSAPDNVVPLPERTPASPVEEPAPGSIASETVRAELAAIRRADPSFDPQHFLQGAKAAFGMIVEAFAKGDKATLRPLLADEVFMQFAGAIDAREQAGRVLSTELVATRDVEIVAAVLVGTRARITVRFTSEQINVTRDAAGEIVEGDPRRIDTVVDVWTFERDVRSRDPNWQLVETGVSI